MEKLDQIEWERFRSDVSNRLNKDQFELVCTLHAKYYKHSYYKPCTCNPRTIKTWIAQLNDVYDENRND